MTLVERKTCRVSDSDLIDVLDLGWLPFSSFPKTADPELEKYPLKLSLSQKSGLVQLRHSVNPDLMFGNYWYLSGINESMKRALKEIVVQATLRVALEDQDIVIDIGSNDGTLLSFYPPSILRVGIDPAKNIKPENCDLHINHYFSASIFQEHFPSKKAKIITSIAMFYDLENPIQFVKDIEAILDPNGIWIIELSYLATMLDRNSFDTICLEHLEYYSLESIEYILSYTSLRVEHVELNEVNGGSFRLYIRFQHRVQETDAVKKMRSFEKNIHLKDPQTYLDFSKRIEENKSKTLSFLRTQKKLGKTVLGYGASTKGNTILAYYDIGPEQIPYIADRNPMKWGHQTVTRIPIISEEEARKMNPDYFFVLPYHFMTEFLQREKEFIKRGGKFISPIPSLLFFP